MFFFNALNVSSSQTLPMCMRSVVLVFNFFWLLFKFFFFFTFFISQLQVWPLPSVLKSQTCPSLWQLSTALWAWRLFSHALPSIWLSTLTWILTQLQVCSRLWLTWALTSEASHSVDHWWPMASFKVIDLTLISHLHIVSPYLTRSVPVRSDHSSSYYTQISMKTHQVVWPAADCSFHLLKAKDPLLNPGVSV